MNFRSISLYACAHFIRRDGFERQCQKKRGFGDNKAYCRQHAELKAKEKSRNKL